MRRLLPVTIGSFLLASAIMLASEAPLARIVGAFVHLNDEKDRVEHVSIRNDNLAPLPVGGWRLLNRDGDGTVLNGVVPPRTVRRFELGRDVPLSSRDGVIRLVDVEGKEVDTLAGHVDIKRPLPRADTWVADR